MFEGVTFIYLPASSSSSALNQDVFVYIFVDGIKMKEKRN